MSSPTVNAVTTVTGALTATPVVLPNILNTPVVFLRHVTRGAVAYFGYVLQGIKGADNIFCQSAQFNGAVPVSFTFTVPAIGAVIPAGSTLLTRGNTTLAKGTRTAYAALGCPAWVIYNAMLPSPAPLALVVNVALAASTMQGAKHTSAVVAAANVAVANATAKPVLVPAAVAAVAASAAGKLVQGATAQRPAVAARPASAGKTAAERRAHGRQV